MLQSSAKALLTTMICGTLAACSSGGGGGSDPTPTNGTPTFSELYEQGEVLGEEIAALDYADPSSLPTSGSVEYNGVMGLAVLGGEGQASLLAGDLTMNVDFDGADPISGTVTNIVNEAEERYQGQLVLGESDIDRTADPDVDYTYGVALAGDVTDPTGVEWDVNADMLGDFLGSNYSHTGGEVYGDACSSADCVNLEGVFGAKR